MKSDSTARSTTGKRGQTARAFGKAAFSRVKRTVTSSLLLMAAAAPLKLSAADYTWSGMHPLWSLSTHWTPNTDLSSGGHTLIFGPFELFFFNRNDLTNLSISSIEFTHATSFPIIGNRLTITRDIINNSTADQFINLPITFNGASITNNTPGTLLRLNSPDEPLTLTTAHDGRHSGWLGQSDI